MSNLVELKDINNNIVYPKTCAWIATATINSGVSMAEGVRNIALNNIISNNPYLTLSNGGIRIGKYITKIRASGGCFIDTPNDGGYNWLRCILNSTTMASCLVAGGMIYKQANISPSVVYDVKEGDIIYLTNGVAGAGTPYSVRSGFSNTWLQVEVVEYATGGGTDLSFYMNRRWSLWLTN